MSKFVLLGSAKLNPTSAESEKNQKITFFNQYNCNSNSKYSSSVPTVLSMVFE